MPPLPLIGASRLRILRVFPARDDKETAFMKILMVTTSHDRMGEGGHATGLWFEELTTPYYAFVDAGATVTIASVAGGKVPVDPRSVKPKGENEGSVDRFLADPAAMAALEGTSAVGAMDARDFDAVFLPGGHGTMWDLPQSAELAKLLGVAWTSGRVVAAVCHGPAGLVAALDGEGHPIVAGRRVTGFTDAEEVAVGLEGVVPFLLESRLRDLGGTFEAGPNFKPHAVADGRLVTGQNPASSALTAHLTLEVAATHKAKAA